MSTFVVGDIQGCFDSLMKLLKTVGFRPSRDVLWCCGDLVNRGPKNLEVLRFLRELGDACVCVLGNHDLHLLARAAEVTGRKPLDTLNDVLGASDRDELIDWLRNRPVVFETKTERMVHAGFLPSWTDGEIKSKANAIASGLSGAGWRKTIGEISATRSEGLGAISAVLQRVRAIDGRENLRRYTGGLEGLPNDCRPWFEPPSKRSSKRVFFGHWSGLGLMVRDDVVCLDTGCVWGGTLTAFELESGEVTSVASREKRS